MYLLLLLNYALNVPKLVVCSLLLWMFLTSAPGVLLGGVEERDLGGKYANVTFVIERERQEELTGSLQLQPVAGGEPVEVAVVDGRAEAALPPGSLWTLSLDADGFWAPEGVVEIPAEAVTIPVRVWPTGTVAGRLRYPEEPHERPEWLEIALESPRANAKPRAVAGGRFDCPVDESGGFRCELPAEELDLVVRVPGFVPIYRWDVAVDATEPVDLGRLTLATGGSLAGWVVTEGREPLPEKIVARIVPRVATGRETRMSNRLGKLREERAVGEDGFFQFAGLAPGSYALEVDAPGVGRAFAAPLDVHSGAETQLPGPLVLQPPIALAVSVTPPLDPGGEPWTATVSRASETSGDFDSRPLVHEPLDRSGRLVLEDQSPGLYSLRISDARGNTFWNDRRLEVETAADGLWQIDLPLLEIDGSVALGDEPLAATLWFGGRYGVERIELRADGEGRFEGYLPRAGSWLVEVVAGDEAVRSTVPTEIGEVEASDGTARVDLRLPDTEVFGRVVGPEDEVVPGARIDLLAGEARAEAEADEAGEFRVRGLPAGEIRLIAASPRRPQAGSSVVVTQMEESVPLGPIVLELRRVREIRGLVVSAGAPVVGATVEAGAATGGGYGDAARTDVDGVFQIRLRDDVDLVHMVISPPGLPLVTAKIRLDAAGEPVVEIPPAGGNLEIRYPAALDPRRMSLLLTRNGVGISTGAVLRWQQGTGAPPATETLGTIELPRVAPRAFTACVTDLSAQAPEPVCDAGQLAPGGTLVLDLGGER